MVEPPEHYKDTMLTPQPLFALFLFYRYYLLQPKYKSIVKHNLNHPAYLKRRDQLIEMAGSPHIKSYLTGSLLFLLGL